MTTPTPTRRAVFTVANPTAQPTREWVRCIAHLLLNYADKQIAAEQREAGRAGDEDQHGGER